MHGLDCDGLSRCNFLMKFGPNGTFSYLMMPRSTTIEEREQKMFDICRFQGIYFTRDACLGNTTALQLWKVKNAESKQQGTDTITPDVSIEEKCQIVNQTRTCSVEYAAQQCTHLSGCVTDTSWMARILVSYSEGVKIEFGDFHAAPHHYLYGQ
ncbi:hypothetical protein RRG08_028725 [Elysia crispata]|uniref:Uncharacterized protein n=1 Tax=Elysia crispata TaxID=231223 RepID=A0AAE0XS58_9GAST|nr:hypothetical protein RRG08_028725 [Elysia crispata]